MSWTAPAPAPVDGPLSGPDRPILTAFLASQRATLLNICAGLTAEQLATRPVPSSNLSLLGLLRHMAKVERVWFRLRMAGEAIEPFYDSALGKDHDFDALDARDAPRAIERFVAECAAADAAAAGFDLDDCVSVHGEQFSLRMIYVHMIGEYGRHNGHADLLREALDGVTGR